MALISSLTFCSYFENCSLRYSLSLVKFSLAPLAPRRSSAGVCLPDSKNLRPPGYDLSTCCLTEL